MNTAYLLLGSNLGNRESYLSQAIELIEKSARKIIATSSLYNTAPWGNTEQNDFLNQVVCVETKLSAEELLRKILSIEKKLGRTRPFDSAQGNKKWQPREIDIDILFFNSEIIKTDKLIVPHPHLQKRRFALVPLAEIARNFIHPVFKKPVSKLLEECDDTLEVRIQKSESRNLKPET